VFLPEGAFSTQGEVFDAKVADKLTKVSHKQDFKAIGFTNPQ
jgi:hypothetical protein